MVDFVEYVVSELKSKRLAKANALELMQQFLGRPTDSVRLHPLVHRNVSTLTQQRYRSHLSGVEFFLRDHRVRMGDGVAASVLPGVAYLEMARAAIADAVPDLASTSLIAFEDVLWLMPLVVEDGRDVFIDIDADEDCLAFRVFSEDAAGNSTDHASGRARFYDAVETASLDLAGIRERMQREHWDSASIYDTYSQVGIEYGPAHRGIVQLDSGEAQVLAELSLPDALAGEDNAAYLLHPSLIDSALQAAIGLGERGVLPTDPMLPFALESLCILSECPQALHAFIRRVESAGDGDNQLVLDLDLCDLDGNICVQMRGFRARRFDAKSAAPRLSATAAVETVVAVPEWGAYRPRDKSAAATGFAHSRVLLCDPTGIDPAALASSLPKHQIETIASSNAADPASRYQAIALQVFEQLQSVLKQHAGASALVQCVIQNTPEALLSSGLGAMLKTASLENPALSAQLVIVEAQVSPRQLAEQLTHAGSQSHISPIQCRADEYRSLDWKTLPHWIDGNVEHPYKEDGVYVITGGLGGLGLVFAQDILGSAQHAQVVLTGRSPLDAAIQQRLDDAGYAARLHYRALDLSDADRCVSTIEDIQNSIGKIRGILHCAGARNDNVILKKTAQEMAEVLAPKVQGTWHLDAATRHLDLDFFALFSSGVSVFGNVGQADYAAANGFLDAFARYRTQLTSQQARSGKTIAIDWPLWQDGGMRPEAETLQWLQAQTGMTPMRTASGIAVLGRALLSDHEQVLAVEGDGRKLRRLFDAPAARVVAKPAPPVSAQVERPAAMPVTGDLLTQAREFLRREFAPVLKISASQIDIHEALENYGINSILAMNLTSQLEKHFGPLPKTLFFEYQTIEALSEHLVQAHAATLQSLLNPAGTPAAAPAAAPASRAMVPARDTARSEAKTVLRGKSAAPAFMARRSQPGQSGHPEPIAVIGLSGRYPEAETLQDYWRNLRDGKDCIVEIPAERWRWESFYTDDREQRGHYSKWGGFIVGADEFDPQFFNVSPREAPYIDPQERMFLQHAWMAIEDAGYSRKSLRIPHGNGLPGQIGVYAGVMYGEYNRSGSLASIANRVSYVLNLHGPSMTLDTMCSSSLTAMHLACQDLRHGRTDMALAGGVNLSIHPDKYSMLSAGQFISTSGHCQSFGEGGDGYIPGEGVGVVILKRLADAERDGDAIYAIIRGSALNHGGKTNGYTVPNPQAQAAVIADALAEAGVDARHVSYIEAHGTGTKLGDPIEIVALSKAFQQNTSDTQFCMLGSAKSNIGHCESAAGVAGLTKVILQMQHRQIVPSLHSERLNPNIDFERTPFIVNQRLHDWDAPVVDGKAVPRIAGLSSFGAGGSNAHFVIQEYNAAPSAAGAFAGLPAIVPLSARTPEQLTQKAQDLLSFLEEASGAGRSVDHAALAYTLQIGRDAMDERLGFVVDSAAQLQDALRAWLGGDISSGFRGQVKANKEMLSLFAADPEYDEAVDKWIAQRKLAKLVDLWVKGFDLDWQKFHGGAKPRRMHLPTYPFAKEKYWIDPVIGLFPLDTKQLGTKPLDALGHAAARSAIHPLLHDNTSDLGQLRFSSVFSGNEPFLGRASAAGLPSTALLEMACAALVQAQRGLADAATIELRALRFGTPFAADGASALHIALYPSANDAIDFDIYSGDDERVHAQGTGRLLQTAPAARLDIDALALRLQAAPSPTGHPHAAWRVWRGAQELLIAVDADVGTGQSGDFLLHPALVQAVLDTAATTLGIGASTPGSIESLDVLSACTPSSIESLDVLSACTPSMRVWVRWHDAHATVWDMDWCDANGNVCLRWRGFVPAGSAFAEAAYTAPTAQLQSAHAFIEAIPMPAASLSKPSAVALAELTVLPPALGVPLPKPSASRLAALDHAISAPVAMPRSAQAVPAPMLAPMPASTQVSAAPAKTAVKPRRREEVLAFLKSTLSQALYLDEASIDNDRSFVDLGLDSIVGVEWVKSINKGLGINIAATRVYDYANIDALGAYVESQLPAQEEAPAETLPAETAAAAPIEAVATPPASVASAAQSSLPSIEQLQPELRRSLAQALYLDENAIDNDKSFVDLGLDSIVGVEWVKAINKAYGLEISATRVYDYATIRALAGFVHGELAKLPPESRMLRATASVPEPVYQAAAIPAATTSVLHTPVHHMPIQSMPIQSMPTAGWPVLQRRARTLPAPAQAHSVESASASSGVENSRRSDEKIAIVGMSGRYPDADNLSQFWRNLVESKNSIKVIPPDRWDVDAYYDPTPGKPGKVYCKWLGLLDGAENFDPMFFQISPSEAEVMDPQHRLFMQESYRAFEDASYSGAALSNQKCGVYLGIMSSEYSFLLSKGNSLNVETTGNSFAIGAARIAYHLNLKGPAIPIDTACSSSLVAIHLASQALLNHEIDMGLAGGVSLYLIPESYVGMCRAGMLSRDGQCKTFDNSADGFVPGEGVGTVVLKRLSDAERDGDSIYGVIIGSGINQDGKTNGITAPSVNSQIELEREIYRRYGIDAASISYVETHGTGTKLGDPIELEALATVFKEHTDRKHFCALGAVKSNIGHVSGAAGVAGVHKVLLSLRHRKLVPNVNLVKENTLFDFANSPFYINNSVQDWTAAPGQKRRAAVSAFGFSGTNAHIVIEEYVPAARRDTVAKQPYIVPLSARTAAQLRSQAEDLLGFLVQADADPVGTDFALRDLAYTLQIGRDAMRERCAWVVGSISELKTQLRAFVAEETNSGAWHRGSVARTQDSTVLTDEAAMLQKQSAKQQTAALAALWAEGATVQWRSFYTDTLPLRMHLPSYPFAKERYWPQPIAQAGTPAAQVAAPQTAVRAQATLPVRSAAVPSSDAIVEAKQKTFYAPTWQTSSLPSQRTPFGREDVLLILDTDDRLYEQIKGRLHVATPLKAIILVQLASAYQQHAADRFSVDASQTGHFDALLAALRTQAQVPTHVIHNLNAARLLADAQDNDAPERALQFGIDGLFGLCKALVSGGAQQSRCAFVSFFHAAEGANTAPCSALAAFYRSLALENNRYSGRVLALDHEGVDAAVSTIDTVTCIVDELQSPPSHDTEIRYRMSGAGSAQRFVRVLTQQHPEQQAMAELPLKHRGVYLVTGGLGGLGYLFARHLAERYRAKLVLSGRSSPSDDSARKLEQLRALGADVLYVSADISDADQVRDLIASAKTHFGSLNGVLHSAGVNRDSLLIRKDRESLRQVLAPKVQGTLHLDRATAEEPLDLFVLFSSGAGSFGNPGQTDYAYANAFMDAFAEHRDALRARRERFGKTLSIGWPFWLDGGMQVSAADLQRTEERSGLCALPTDVGIAYWETLLRSDSTRALALYGYPSKIAAYCDPSAGSVSDAKPQSGAIDRETLRTLAQQYLCELVHNETRVPVELIDINERFEAFGFDSIMIGRFNAALEHDLGDLPKTLLYEYETVADLAGYLCEFVQEALGRRLSIAGAATETTAADLPQEIAHVPAALEAPSAHAEPIAIIGVHADFPQSRDLHTFWEHLKAGDDLIQLVPENRWNYADFYDPDPEQAENGKIYCKWGGFLEDFDKFDAAFFNIPDAEANIIDPQERCFLQSSWAAVEDAGYTRERLKQMYPKGKSTDVGVFVGVTTNSYNLLAPEAWQRGQMVTPSAMPWSIANRVSYYFDFQGPSMPIDTACSSSLVAVHLACESLRRRECQLALAGGVNLYLHPAKYQSFCQRRMLAVGDQNRSYGAGDDGFVPGEGVGTLVLKPLRLAEQDGDPIRGVILGSAFDHSGRSNGYATPNPNAQAQVIGQALAQANVPARSISFIEGHGTGTQMGDSLEIAAISQAFGQQTDDKAFCALGSVKANIGHAESATSIAGIAKILLQFKHRQIAPSIHADVANPDIDFARSPCRLQTQLTAWQTSGQAPRRALINAFGAGGVNACAVLEEYVPAATRAPTATRGSSVFLLSAMNADRLREYASRYLAFLDRTPEADIASLCHTTQVGREPMFERLALLVDSTAQLRDALQQWLAFDGQAAKVTAPLWRGSLDARRASMPATREQREQMQALCAAQDMAALAQYWVQGGKVNWQRAHPGPLPVGMSLPTYPFARERHWIVDTAPSGRAPASAAPSRLHPLLSHNSSTLKQISFDAALADDQYYAREHRIQGQPVFPGAGFIEMACVAATIAGQRRVRQLKDIFWVQPLALGHASQDHASQSLQISLRNAVGDSTEFAVKTYDDDNDSVLHCEGRVIFHDGAAHRPAVQPSLAEWRQRCRDRHAGSEYYQSFKRLGFEYGTAFQIIDEVSIGDGCAIASLQLANAQTADFEQYILHPCLIDGALQTVVALLAADDGGVPHLPFAIDEIEILGSLTPRCYALVERSGNEHDAHASVLQFNILIVSESGEPLVKITNFYVRALVMPETPAVSQTRNDARLPMAVNP